MNFSDLFSINQGGYDTVPSKINGSYGAEWNRGEFMPGAPFGGYSPNGGSAYKPPFQFDGVFPRSTGLVTTPTGEFGVTPTKLPIGVAQSGGRLSQNLGLGGFDSLFGFGSSGNFGAAPNLAALDKARWGDFGGSESSDFVSPANPAKKVAAASAAAGGDSMWTMGNLSKVLEGLGAIGNVWTGWEANNLARDELSFQQDSYKTNLANQISAFNMALEDRARTGAIQNGTSASDRDAYIDKYKMRG